MAKEEIKEKKETENSEPEKKEGMVQIPAKQITELLDRMKNLESDNAMLLQVVDKRALGAFYQRNKGKMPGRVKLRMMGDRVIVGWRTLNNEVYKNPATMVWTEKQTVELLYEDGKSEEFYYTDYIRKYTQVEAEVKSKIVDEVTGDVALKVVRIDTGKEYMIDVKYVN